MEQKERDLFIGAVIALKNNINNNFAYDEIVKVHADTMEFKNWSAHGNDALLPWHRLYAYHFESLLRAQLGFENVTVPYWDWTTFPTKGVLPFTNDFMGAVASLTKAVGLPHRSTMARLPTTTEPELGTLSTRAVASANPRSPSGVPLKGVRRKRTILRKQVCSRTRSFTRQN
jgi:hypothetical protein